MKKSIKDLKFVRLTSPDQFKLVPPYLFEQIKQTGYITQRIYQFAPVTMMNPTTFIYVLADKNSHLIKGIFWADINPFDETLGIHIASVDKEYQGNGTIVTIINHAKKIKKEYDLKKIRFFTRHPRCVLKKCNAQRSKHILVEVE